MTSKRSCIARPAKVRRSAASIPLCTRVGPVRSRALLHMAQACQSKQHTLKGISLNNQVLLSATVKGASNLYFRRTKLAHNKVRSRW
jgi:hypothetical protein